MTKCDGMSHMISFEEGLYFISQILLELLSGLASYDSRRTIKDLVSTTTTIW